MPAIAPAHIGMTWLLDPTPPRYATPGFYIRMVIFQDVAVP